MDYRISKDDFEQKYHPTLALSIYHKPEDIVTLPSFIKTIAPEYKLFLRCYHEDHTETVLYAIWPERFGVNEV